MGMAESGLNETSLHSSCQEISYIVPPNAVPVRVTFCSPCSLCLWHPWRCSAGFTQLGEVELTLQEALSPAVLAWGIKFSKKNSCFDQGDTFIKYTYISIYLFIYLRERKEKEKKIKLVFSKPIFHQDKFPFLNLKMHVTTCLEALPRPFPTVTTTEGLLQHEAPAWRRVPNLTQRFCPSQPSPAETIFSSWARFLCLLLIVILRPVPFLCHKYLSKVFCLKNCSIFHVETSQLPRLFPTGLFNHKQFTEKA